MHSSKRKEQFIEMLKKHKKILYKVIYSYCKNPEDRKDLEQEIVVQLWKSMSYYDEKYELSTWIYKVAMNVSISFYREGAKRTKNTAPLDDYIFQISDDNGKSEELSHRKQLLHNFISQLDELNRAIMLLYLEDYGYKEIAEVIGITETNVATKISRIKQELRNDFSEIN
ncbi:MAG: RNA polymerase sigma factor (sigma-70 family) [Maribacter sp.]